MKVIIAGSRSFEDYLTLCDAVSNFPIEITEVVSGGARGADRLGEKWARKRSIPIKQFIPDWDNLGKSAGFIRNSDMADYADALIALWDGESKGTKNMIDTARKRGLVVFIHRV